MNAGRSERVSLDSLQRAIRSHHEELDLPWCESPFFEDIVRDAGLSEAEERDARTFREQGFLLVDDCVDEVTALAAAQADEPRLRRPTRVTNAWEWSPPVRDLALLAPVRERLRLLYAREPVPFQTLNFEYGTEQSAHMDTVHFQSRPRGYMCGVWFALEDSDASNGPLFYYPGSHTLPAYDLDDLGVDVSGKDIGERYQSYQRFLSRLVQVSCGQPMELHRKTGQGVIWSARLIHGGAPIRARGRTRRSQVSHYFFEGCRYYAPLQSDFERRFVFFVDARDLRTGAPLAAPPLVRAFARQLGRRPVHALRALLRPRDDA